ncbi:Na+/H+ antiporter subunit G [Allosaccharopolyspora coralli]|uniref:Na+/H+ antiporter subunit G n=1 Tax=Allosaccharopolyspora coralli TaxID=2665642 RepID=A0A5Q3Q9I6_9PSEU|nr:monovalent cation/H(+) antiporter subunit G [Allosaccharopolyspora coralli]QGK71361.1 Na+/H+ antiporter subunit G [Allosaccharopolyspora coralli]
MSWDEILAAILMITGAVSCVFGAIGLVTFPDVTSRLQAATKPQTLGLILILLGTAVELEFRYATGLLLVALLQLLTAPILAQLVGRAAYRSDSIRRDRLVVDELTERLQSERR